MSKTPTPTLPEGRGGFFTLKLGTMAKILRNGDCIIPLDKILAVHIPNPGDKVVEVILSNYVRFSFHCKTSEEAKETLNIIQKKLEDSE